MQDFDYVSAKHIDDVVSILSSNEQAKILNGGTDLLVQIREGRRKVSVLVDIKNIPELNELRVLPSEGLWLGSAVTCMKFCDDMQAAEFYPGLVDAVSLVGGTQIQGRATIGGNLCNASPAADCIPALIVHQAVCEIAGPGGRREVRVENFCTGPGKNCLERGELLVGLRIPFPEPGFGARYLRFIPRNEMDIAVVGAGAGVKISEDGHSFVKVRLAVGAAAPTPLLVQAVGDALAGCAITAEVIEQAVSLAQEASQPIRDMRGSIEQRRHLVKVMSRRAIEGAVDRARLGQKMLV